MSISVAHKLLPGADIGYGSALSGKFGVCAAHGYGVASETTKNIAANAIADDTFDTLEMGLTKQTLEAQIRGLLNGGQPGVILDLLDQIPTSQKPAISALLHDIAYEAHLAGNTMQLDIIKLCLHDLKPAPSAVPAFSPKMGMSA